MANIVPAGGLRSGYIRLRSTVANLKKKTERVVANVAHTGEAAITAAGAGLMNGAFNDPTVANVPLDFAIGSGLIAAGVLMGDDVGDHLTALGIGPVCVFSGRKSRKWGVAWSAKQNNVSVEEIESRRARNLNDDGTARGSAGDHPGAG